MKQELYCKDGCQRKECKCSCHKYRKKETSFESVFTSLLLWFVHIIVIAFSLLIFIFFIPISSYLNEFTANFILLANLIIIFSVMYSYFSFIKKCMEE